MFCALKFLMILIAAGSTRAAAVDSIENTFNCYLDYLKRQGLLENDFKSELFNGEAELCDTVLSTTTAAVYSALLDEFRQIDAFENSSECIVETLRKAKWSDLDIKEQVYEFIDSLSAEEKKTKISEIKKRQENISSEAIISCMAEKEFGELFDQIFYKDEQEDFVLDYCARSYVFDNKLVDSTVYEISMNPRNIITKNIKCDHIIAKNFKAAEEELREHLLKEVGENSGKVDCLIKKYHEHRYFNKTLAIELLGELNISDGRKAIEKENFIKFMIEVTKNLGQC